MLFSPGASQVVVTEIQVPVWCINMCVCKSHCRTWYSKGNHWLGGLIRFSSLILNSREISQITYNEAGHCVPAGDHQHLQLLW